MSQAPQPKKLESEILESLALLTHNLSTGRVNEKLVTELNFRRFLREIDKVEDASKKWLLKAILQVNFNRDLKTAEEYFQKAITLDRLDVVAWTHFPSTLIARGFASAAHYWCKEAIKVVPCMITCGNLYASAADVRDVESIRTALSTLQKMYPSEITEQHWGINAMSFLRSAAKQTERLGSDDTAISDALLKAKDFLGELGYSAGKSVTFFDDFRDDVFVVLEVNSVSDEELAQINMSVADFMVDNDYMDLGLVVAVSPVVMDEVANRD